MRLGRTSDVEMGRYGRLRKAADAAAIDVSHLPAPLGTPLPVHSLPFSQDPGGYLADTALGVAIAWFSERGYVVSVPVKPTYYDLVTESDDGLKRVQIKSSSKRNRHGNEEVSIGRQIYDGSRPMNSGGRRRWVAYGAAEVDVFFILTASGKTYLVPQAAVPGLMCLTLTSRFDNFIV